MTKPTELTPVFKTLGLHAESPEAIKAVVAARTKARKAAIKAKANGKAKPESESKPARPLKGRVTPEKPKAKPAAKAKADNLIEIKPRGGKAISMRKGTTQAKFYAALLRPEGASADELEKITGYTRSTLMSAIHGGRLKGKLKLMAAKLVVTEDEKRGGKVYSIRAK